MTRSPAAKHRHEVAYPALWAAVSGAVKSAMDAHPEFVIPTPASITKRVVGSLLAPEVRAALAVENGAREIWDLERQRKVCGGFAQGDGPVQPVARLNPIGNTGGAK